jgi:hypothetical protein
MVRTAVCLDDWAYSHPVTSSIATAQSFRFVVVMAARSKIPRVGLIKITFLMINLLFIASNVFHMDTQRFHRNMWRRLHQPTEDYA